MTDLEKVEALFKDLSIPFSNEPCGTLAPDKQVVHLETGEGYHGFYAEFIFDQSGKFIEYGIWE